jgi:hypothetical protein
MCNVLSLQSHDVLVSQSQADYRLFTPQLLGTSHKEWLHVPYSISFNGRQGFCSSTFLAIHLRSQPDSENGMWVSKITHHSEDSWFTLFIHHNPALEYKTLSETYASRWKEAGLINHYIKIAVPKPDWIVTQLSNMPCTMTVRHGGCYNHYSYSNTPEFGI